MSKMGAGKPESFERNFNRRALFQDYKAPTTYHITIVKSRGIPCFSHITPEARVVLSELGLIIYRQLKDFFSRNARLMQLYQYVIMPDHIHLLLRVTTMMPKHLGCYIAVLEGNISRAWNNCLAGNPDSLRAGEFRSVFEKNYNDKIITLRRSLDTVFNYIRQNPRRLAVRMANPDYFRRIRRLPLFGRDYIAYGNLQLLDNPFKTQVVIHRSDTPEIRRANRQHWLRAAANGGVLVSPFISAPEKEIRREAEELGGRFILITNEPLKEREKPADHDFGLCCQGRLLIVAPEETMSLDRGCCLAMNSLAERLSAQ